MAHYRQRGFQSLFSGPCLALTVMTTLMRANASTTAQQQRSAATAAATANDDDACYTERASLPAGAGHSVAPCVSYLIGNLSSPPMECCAQIRVMLQS